MDNFDLKKYLVENKVTRNSRMLTEQADREAKKPKHSRMMKEESGKPDKTSMRLFLDELGFNSADGLFRTAMNAGDVHELIDMMADSAGGGQHPFDGTLTRGDFSQAGNAAGFSAEMIEDILDRDDVRTLERGIGEAKKPKHSRMMKEADSAALQSIADIISTYAEEDPQDAAEVVAEAAMEYLEGDLPSGMFNNSMLTAVAGILKKASTGAMSELAAARQLVRALKDPANYGDSAGGGIKVGAAGATVIFVDEESSLQDTQYYTVTTNGKSKTVSVDVSGEPVTLEQVVEETGLSEKEAQIIVRHINSQLD